MNRRLLVVGAALLAGLVGCSSTQPVPVPPGSPSPEDPSLSEFYDQQVSWQPCNGRFECTKLTVPLSYEDPGGETIQLDVVRLPAAKPDERLGSLVINPGGPGGSGVDYARAARGVMTGDLINHYDVVGFDPRGVGKSDPIECLNDRQLDRFLNANPDPEATEDVAAAVSVSKRLGPRCEKRSPELTPNIGTPYVVKDLDVLRSVLGDEHLNYLGKSYGTLIGAMYAEQFPTRVGRMVLDGAVDPALSNAQISKGQALGFEKALQRFAEWCAKKKDCPLGDDPQAGIQKVIDFIAQVEQDPIPAEKGRPLTAAQALTGIVGSLYSAEGWEQLFYDLQNAFKGDGVGLQAQSDWLNDRRPDGSYASNSTEAMYAVNCIDRPDRFDPAQTEQMAEDWSKEAPVFGPALAWGNLACYYWPVPAVDKPHEINAPGAAPIVVVGTEFDPATPYEWAVSLADQLDSGVLVSWLGGDGHTAYYSGSKCIDRTVDDYLVEGTVPQDGLECS